MPGNPRAKFAITADNSDYRNKIRQAKRDTQTFSGSVKQTLKAGAVAGAASVGLLTAQLARMTREANKNIDALAKQSDKLGIATDKLAALQLAGRLTGVENKKLTLGLQRMTRRIAEAAQGTGAAQTAIAELGLDARKLARLPLDRQFETIAQAMAGVKNQSDRIRLGFKLFDSEGVDLINTLQAIEGQFPAVVAEARAFGLAISRVEAKQIERANDAVERARSVSTGLANTIAIAVAPIREGLANALVDAARESNGFRSEVAATMEALIRGANFAINGVRGIVLAFKAAKLAVLSIQESALGFLEETASASPYVGLRKLFPKEQTDQVRRELVEAMDETGRSIDELFGKFQSGDVAIQKYREAVAASVQAARQDVEQLQSAVTTTGAGGDKSAALFTDAERKALTSRIDAIRNSLMTEKETLLQARDERFALLDEGYQRELISFEDKESLKLDIAKDTANKIIAIDRRRTQELQRIEAQHNAVMVGFRAAAVDQTLGLLFMLGANSKKLARAAVLVEKAVAVTRIIIHTNAAAARALAEVPFPANLAAAAKIKTWGYGLAAATAALGIAQAAQVGGGGVGGLGGIGTSTSISAADSGLGTPANEAETVTPRSVTHIHVAGSLLAGQDTLDSLKRWIQDLTDADEVIINNNTRQAAEIRGG